MQCLMASVVSAAVNVCNHTVTPCARFYSVQFACVTKLVENNREIFFNSHFTSIYRKSKEQQYVTVASYWGTHY